MKAILVLKKMPRDCDSCPLLDGNRYCAALQKYAFLNEWVSDAPYYSLKEKGDCPLKLLPKHKNIYTDIDAMGWNACIEEITGKKEDCRDCQEWESCPCGKAGHDKGTSIGYSIGECKHYKEKQNESRMDK